MGTVNGTVKRFSTEKGIITETRRCGESNQGRFTGLAVTDRYSGVDKDTGHNTVQELLFQHTVITHQQL